MEPSTKKSSIEFLYKAFEDNDFTTAVKYTSKLKSKINWGMAVYQAFVFGHRNNDTKITQYILDNMEIENESKDSCAITTCLYEASKRFKDVNFTVLFLRYYTDKLKKKFNPNYFISYPGKNKENVNFVKKILEKIDVSYLKGMKGYDKIQKVNSDSESESD